MIELEIKDKVASGKKVLLSFHTNWCPSCKMINKELTKLPKDIELIEIDVEQSRKLATQYRVMGVPTLIAPKQDGTNKRIYGYAGIDSILELFD